jgi:hypothetical protein
MPKKVQVRPFVKVNIISSFETAYDCLPLQIRQIDFCGKATFLKLLNLFRNLKEMKDFIVSMKEMKGKASDTADKVPSADAVPAADANAESTVALLTVDNFKGRDSPIFKNDS